MGRTDTIEEFERLKNNLDQVVEEISESIGFQELNQESMIKILQQLASDYPDPEVLWEMGVERYDIGYTFIKQQILCDIGKSEENSMLIDGVMGWLYYNRGTCHDKEMNAVLQAYVTEFGIEKLSSGFQSINEGFEHLYSIAKSNEVLKVANEDYNTTFTQCGSHTRLKFRRRDVKKLFPDFQE